MNSRIPHSSITAVLLGFASFLVYCGMYFIRKPITALDYSSTAGAGMDYKVAIIVSQILGYTLSKFIGIRSVSGVHHDRRSLFIALCAASAITCLLLFAILPDVMGLFCMFFNGLALGLVWGILFSYVEGRNATDMIGLFLSTSFILASGAAKSATVYLSKVVGVENSWAPFLVSLLAIPMMALGLWILERAPAPTSEEQLERSTRRPMTGEDRREMFRQIRWTLLPLTALYVILTIYRDTRDSFMVDIMNELMIPYDPSIFAGIELGVTLVTIALLVGVARIKQHRLAVSVHLMLMTLSIVIVGLSTLLFFRNQISAPIWVFFTGVGTYVAYVPFNSMVFERLLALNRFVGTVGFLMYFADAFGYLASCTLYIGSSVAGGTSEWTGTFLRIGLVYVILGPLMLAVTAFDLRKVLHKTKSTVTKIA